MGFIESGCLSVRILGNLEHPDFNARHHLMRLSDLFQTVTTTFQIVF